MKKMLVVMVTGCALGLPGILQRTEAQAPAGNSAGVGITKVEITKRSPAFGGGSFGSAGPYEFLLGTAYGELDPNDAQNARIVNIKNTPVNARGHVEYSMDITILKPVDINKGNGRLVYDVANRGHEKAISDLNLSHFDGTGPSQVTNPASAFIMKHGYTFAWSGWEAEASEETARPGLLKAKFPIAMKDGKPLVGMSREEFSSVGTRPTFNKTLTYPAANLDTAAATLTVRQLETDPRKPLPASSWTYINPTHVRIGRAEGYDAEALYELVYPATSAVVQGIAFISVRDFVSFLRYADKDSVGTPNPVHPATPFKAVIGMGVSQSGRLLKDMVYKNFHVDASGRKLFDGILDVVSGSRATAVNMEFSQPGRFSRQHEDHNYPNDQFPFTYATTTDPISGKTDGLQAICGKNKTCPPTMHVDTDTETWQGHGSLVFTDPTGKPVAIPDNVRIYVPTGIPHNGRDLGDLWESTGKPERGMCKEYRNPLEYRYYIRALFTALDEWATEGKLPPASRYPNLKDKTLVTVEEAGKLWPTIPGVPFTPVLSKLRLTDYRTQPPTVSGPEYPLFVARTNADGNPLGGIEPPEITVPIATYSGRNRRAAGSAEGDLCGLNGSYIPLAVTKAERLATKDSRLSLEERYKSQEDFAAKRKAAADKLVQQRLLLAEDAPLFSAVQLPKP